MSEDPIMDGLNWYAYCSGNPVVFIDPSGLAKSSTNAMVISNNYVNIPNIDANGNQLSGPEEKSRYTQEFIDYIKSYETHTIENSRHILSNGGATIGYGHDLSDEEIKSGIYANGITEEQAIKLLIKDLDIKYDSICRYINTLNNDYGYSINIDNFSTNEINYLLDFAFNRGKGIAPERQNLKAIGKPYNSLPMLIVATSQKDDAQIINILKEETKNTKGVYYQGLELRRMDGYEIYKYGNYVRDYDINRGYK